MIPIRQIPGGQSLIEVSGAQPNQLRTDLIEPVLTGQNPQQAAQGDRLADLRKQPLQQRQTFGLHPLMDNRTILRRARAPESGQQRFGQRQLQVHQFFRMQGERRQPEPFQTGPPQIFQRRAGIGEPFAPGCIQQPLPRPLRDIVLKSAGGAEFFHLPDQLVQRQRLHPVNQRNPQHFAAPDRPFADLHQWSFRRQRRALAEYRIQIDRRNSLRPIELAELRIGQIGMNPGQLLGSGQRLFKRQMLIAVQGVVMNEIQDRGLRRQQMIQMR